MTVLTCEHCHATATKKYTKMREDEKVVFIDARFLPELSIAYLDSGRIIEYTNIDKCFEIADMRNPQQDVWRCPVCAHDNALTR